MTKKELRAKYIQLRQELSQTSIDNLSLQLGAILSSALPKKVGTLHIYLPIENKKEINTWKILDLLREHHPNLDIVVPSMNKDLSMESLLLKKDATIELTNYDIPEPQEKITIDHQAIDCIILPLLCFDEQGFRVGYGKGVYDRFLSQLDAKVLKIGLSLFEPIASINDVNEFDQKMDLCITPKSTHSF